MDVLVQIACQGAALAAAVVGGVFLTFSDFAMRALDRAGPGAGMAAMQAINREVVRIVFMALPLGLGPVLVGLALLAWAGAPERAGWIAAAAAVHLAGVIGVTASVNVPLNRRLDGCDPARAADRAFWTWIYLPVWTCWNHLRMAACLLAAALLSAAALRAVG